MPSLLLGDRTVAYSLRRSSRTHHIRLTINSQGEIHLTIPSLYSVRKAEDFLRQKSDWIIRALKKQRSRITLPKSAADYKEKKALARDLVQQRLDYFNQSYHHNWQRLTIRNSRTRWGSCSRQGNLNFNYKIFYLPPELQDYIIVHELCHLQEMNHSRKFWTLVAKTQPQYQEYRRALKKFILA